MPLSRRSLLGLGAGGLAVATAVAGAGLALQRPVVSDGAVDLKTLSADEHGILAGIAEALCPGDPGLPSAVELGVASRVDQTVARMHPGDQEEFKMALWLIESALVGVVLDGRVRGLSHLGLADRTRVLEGWRTSGLSVRRKAFRAVSGLVLAAYWSHPATWKHVGYGGPPEWMRGGQGGKDGG